MTTLGSCLIANELTPVAKELLQMRIDGKSWAEIAESKGLKSPGAARKLFTKETGLTDYKIKGDTLKAMLEKGYDPTATADKIKEVIEFAEKEVGTAPVFNFEAVVSPEGAAKTAVKAETNVEAKAAKLYEKGDHVSYAGQDYKVVNQHEFQTYVQKADGTGDIIGVKPDQKMKPWVDKAPSFPAWEAQPAAAVATPSLSIPSYDVEKVVELYKKGNTYSQIVSKTGLGFKDIDQIVWQDIMAGVGDIVPEGFLIKPTSQSGIQAMKDFLAAERAGGSTIAEIAENLNEAFPGKFTEAKVKALLEKDVQTLSAPGYFGNIGAYIPPSTFTAPPKIVASGEYPLFGLDDAKAWSQALGSDMSTETLSALKRYTGSEYSSINGNLRRGTSNETIRNLVDAMDRGMRPMPKPVTVIRRTGTNAFGTSDLSGMEGIIFSDKGYLSTAVTEGVWSGEVEMVIQCPAGTMGRYAKPFSRHPGENELILARNTRMMIDKVEKIGNRWRLTMTVIV